MNVTETPYNPGPQPPAAPIASWNLRDLKDTREFAIEAIRAAQAVPPACKALLVELLEQRTDRLVRVDAHCHVVTTARGVEQIITAHITPL